jgi:hypothetical protein
VFTVHSDTEQGDAPDKKKEVRQCPTCPWRVDCEPLTDIPNYVPELHHKLDHTIAEPGSLCGLGAKTMHVMACHYSKPGEEFACAGWLHNQLGPGNNIAVRLRVITGDMPVPVVDGEQYETFEETLCNVPKSGAAPKVSSTKSRTKATPSSKRAAGGRSRGTTRTRVKSTKATIRDR